MIMQRLKTETRLYHERLEAHPFNAVLMRPDVTLQDYRQLLSIFYGFYRPLETHLAELQPFIDFDFTPRHKCHSLEKDLQALGIVPSTLPLCAALPPLENSAALWGCWYVLEGASLGGQIITRHLLRQFGTDLNVQFFSGYGENTGEMWRHFRESLTHAATNDFFCDTVVDSAIRTFVGLENWLILHERGMTPTTFSA